MKRSYESFIEQLDYLCSVYSTTNAEELNRLKLLKDFIEKPIILERFKTAPASTQVSKHQAYPGGLIDHILEVYEFLIRMTTPYSSAIIFRAATLHDICKIGDSQGSPYYVPNILKGGKQSDAKPYEIEYDNRLSFGQIVPADSLDINPNAYEEIKYLWEQSKKNLSHGNLSLALIRSVDINLFNSLTEDEIEAIKYHDGGYGDKYSQPSKLSALAIYLHCADMLSSRSKKE